MFILRTHGHLPSCERVCVCSSCFCCLPPWNISFWGQEFCLPHPLKSQNLERCLHKRNSRDTCSVDKWRYQAIKIGMSQRNNQSPQSFCLFVLTYDKHESWVLYGHGKIDPAAELSAQYTCSTRSFITPPSLKRGQVWSQERTPFSISLWVDYEYMWQTCS